MLANLKLRAFRRFHEHEVPLGPTTVLVGANNAGKSTVVEALRLAALVVRVAPNARFEPPPAWTQHRRVDAGARPSLADRGFVLRTAIHGLGDPPATITLTYATGASVDVLVSADEVFGIIRIGVSILVP